MERADPSTTISETSEPLAQFSPGNETGPAFVPGRTPGFGSAIKDEAIRSPVNLEATSPMAGTSGAGKDLPVAAAFPP